MKRILTLFAILASLFVCTAASAQASRQTISRIRGNSTDLTHVVDVTLFGNTFDDGTQYGLHALAGVYFYDGANFRWWLGAQMNADNIAATTYAPWVGSFAHGWDSVGSVWERVHTDGAGSLSTYISGSDKDAAVDDDSTTACVAITNASVRYTLPTNSNYYNLCAHGNSAYLLCGATGVPVATLATNGHFSQVGSGQCIKMLLTGPDCAVIGPSTAGQLCFIHHVP